MFFVAAIHIPFFLGFILFVLVPMMALGVYFDKKRTAALREAARELRFEFFPKGGPLKLADLSGFHLMQRGSSRRFQNLMHGSAQGVDVSIFDYQFTESGGEDSTTYYTTVARFRSLELDLPEFSLRPEGLFHKIGKAFGFKDMDFPMHPAFSKMFLLRGPDEAAIRALFDIPLIAALEPMKGISVEGASGQLIFYRHNKRVDAGAMRAFFEEAFRVFSQFADASKRQRS